MRVKIHGGTLGSENMCHSCDEAIVKNKGLSCERIFCYAATTNPVLVREPVFQCSMWSLKGSTSLKQMEDAAWLISTSRPRRVGFAPGASPLEVVIRAPKEKEDE